MSCARAFFRVCTFHFYLYLCRMEFDFVDIIGISVVSIIFLCFITLLVSATVAVVRKVFGKRPK